MCPILDFAAGLAAAANKWNQRSISVFAAHVVLRQLCEPRLVQNWYGGLFSTVQSQSVSFGHSFMFVLEALAALCESTDW